MKHRFLDNLISIVLVISFMLFIITFSISFTILFRPFYYYHINYLNLENNTGYSYDEIKEAYDDVLDYCTYSSNFSVGKLKYSEDGKSHFKDCKLLFIINFIVLGISTIIIVLKKVLLDNIKILKHSIEFWSGIFVILLFLISFIITISIGFDKVFTIFHNIFFLGKKNWLFDPSVDEIIAILPKQYFMNCAILIIVISIIISIIFIIKDKKLKER